MGVPGTVGFPSRSFMEYSTAIEMFAPAAAFVSAKRNGKILLNVFDTVVRMFDLAVYAPVRRAIEMFLPVSQLLRRRLRPIPRYSRYLLPPSSASYGGEGTARRRLRLDPRTVTCVLYFVVHPIKQCTGGQLEMPHPLSVDKTSLVCVLVGPSLS